MLDPIVFSNIAVHTTMRCIREDALRRGIVVNVASHFIWWENIAVIINASAEVATSRDFIAWAREIEDEIRTFRYFNFGTFTWTTDDDGCVSIQLF